MVKMKNYYDIFKMVEDLDKDDVSENSDFLDSIIDDYYNVNIAMSNMAIITSLANGNDVNSFSHDIEKFKNECLNFINFIGSSIEGEEISTLYLIRSGNKIHYGSIIENGLKNRLRVENDTIEMISDEDLRLLYELIKKRFSSGFKLSFKHTFGEGWTLNPIINEKVMIDINSDNVYDRKWFYEESHIDQRNDFPVKNK